MQRTRVAAIAAAALAGATLALPATTAQVGAAPAARPSGADQSGTDNLLRPWQKKFQEQNRLALEQRLRSGGRGDSERLARGVHGKVATTGPDKVFALLVEFGDTRHSAYCDETEDTAPAECAYPSDGTAQRYDGPLHNEIPKPDRDVDNTTPWEKNFNRAFYRDMYFRRMANYYDRQSNGRYSFTGDVTQWVTVPFNEARYGRDFCGDIVCTNTWFLVRDGLAQWVQDRLDSGWTDQELHDYLADYDIEDRYDFDGDGDYREPDGYIDHLQVVHAGGDQADGDPIFGSDAIWSHRWYAELTAFGEDGPDNGAPFGGFNVGEGGISDPDGSAVQIPDNPTGIWAGDYTMQPENGGLGVFAHEYAHDLGLPDLYDTSGNTGGAENSTGFWTIMSSGSNVGRLNAPDIGDQPTSFSAWEKFTLGWLDYKVVRAGRTLEQKKLRPLAKKNGRADQAVLVLLPEKRAFLELGEPCTGCGEAFFWSGMGDELDNTMTRAVDGGGELTAQVRYDIEEGYDYAFLEYSTDGGDTWEAVDTSESYDGDDFSGGDSAGFGLSGTQEEWTQLEATIPDGANAIRWHYRTDPAIAPTGFQVDQITLDGAMIGSAETGDEGWTFDGFSITTGDVDRGEFLHGYFVENRQYVGDDRSLKGIYNFGFLGERDFWVEKFAYEPGALIWYWDSSYSDNNVGDHPGHGLLLPVDAHPSFDHYPDDTMVRPRILSYDSTFSKQRADRLRLHYFGERYRVEGSPAVRAFRDRKDWWFNSDEHAVTGEHEGRYQPGWVGVDVPKTGTVVKVLRVNKKGVMTVRVKAGRG